MYYYITYKLNNSNIKTAPDSKYKTIKKYINFLESRENISELKLFNDKGREITAIINNFLRG